MKAALLIALIVILNFALSAQTKSELNQKVIQHELGIAAQLNNLGNPILIYRVGVPKSLWRFSLLNLNHFNKTDKNNDASANVQRSHEIGLRAGKEFRRPINEKFTLRYGADINFNYSSSKSQIVNTSQSPEIYQQFIYGINGVFGANYQITENLLFGAEIQPVISYRVSVSNRQIP